MCIDMHDHMMYGETGDPRDARLTCWIFTFGVGQVNAHTGERMGNRFVRIYADSSENARKEMFHRFGRIWSMQYESEEQAGIKKWGLIEYTEER